MTPVNCPFAAKAAITLVMQVIQPGAIGSPKKIGPEAMSVPAIKLNATPSSKVSPKPIDSSKCCGLK